MEHSKLKRMVSNAVDLTAVAREMSERDRDYYDEHQISAEERAVLNSRKQPIIVNNRIKRKVDAMVGIEQRMRVDPRAYPRTPQHEPAAMAATKGLVYVDDATRFDYKRSMVFENTIVEGYGGVEVVVEPVRGRLEIAVNRLRWEEIFADPFSREKDFSDATYIGTQKWMSLDEANDYLSSVYEGDDLDELLQQSIDLTGEGSTYDDRPSQSGYQWADKRQKRVRLAHMYYKSKGQWRLAIFSGGGVFYDDVSPYLDEDGEPDCPIILMTAYIDRENRRYGVVRSMISQQDEINKRRSKLLHQLNTRQTAGVKGGVDSVANLKRELSKPDGHVEINIEAIEDAARVGQKAFEILPNSDQISGQFALLEESKNEIDALGPNPSLIGQAESGASGRAIMAQQQAGMAELAPLYDSLRDWTIRVYRAMWARMRQFWTEERWVRITDTTGALDWVGFNVPQGPMQVLSMDGQVQLHQQLDNPIAEMDVDIVIEDTPDHVTLQQEQFEQLNTMADRGIPIPPEMIIKASSIPDKQEVLEALKQQQEAAMQAAAAEAQRKAELEGKKAEGAFQKDMASAAKSAADAQRTQVETAQMTAPVRLF